MGKSVHIPLLIPSRFIGFIHFPDWGRSPFPMRSFFYLRKRTHRVLSPKTEEQRFISINEKHFPVFRERPVFIRNYLFQRIRRLADFAHCGNRLRRIRGG